MFARFLELKAKPGQGRALCNLIEEKALPIVKKHSGFVEEFSLIPEETPDTVLIVSFWENKEAAEKFRTESYRALADMYQPLLASAIQVRGCDVAVATTAKAKAARR